MGRGRPRKEFDKKTFEDLVGLGCESDEICWFFRDVDGKPVHINVLSRWCKRTYGLNFSDYKAKNGGMALKIKLRRNQFKLSEKSAAMAIFLGKNYLGQKDSPEQSSSEALERLDAILRETRENAARAGELEYLTEDELYDQDDRAE